MNIPTIGGARGIFEIFIPGTFLLLNLSVVAYLFPFIDDETKALITAGASNEVAVLVVAVSFGYLIGLLLRLFRPALPDRLSGVWLRTLNHRARQNNSEFAVLAREDFPYFDWIGEVCERFLPPETRDFYDRTWALKKHEGPGSPFFNFCKIMISSEDEQSASEIYAAEALVRYMSGMFYALVLAFLLILVTVIFRYIVFGQAAVGLIIMLCAYLFAIGAILSRFRFMRTKEVETVFAASFKNRSVFEEETTLEARSAPPTCVLGSSQALLGIFLAGLLGFVAGNRLRRP